MITIFIDGACEPVNPWGWGACAFVAFEGQVAGNEFTQRPAPIGASAKLIGNGLGMTNNVAEWRALRGALTWCTMPGKLKVDLNVEKLELFMDSQLVVNQFNGEWNCNSPGLVVFRDECLRIAKQLPGLKLTWVPRQENWVADAMINQLYAQNTIKVTVRKKKVNV
jgi:ribonuclease HI